MTQNFDKEDKLISFFFSLIVPSLTFKTFSFTSSIPLEKQTKNLGGAAF